MRRLATLWAGALLAAAATANAGPFSVTPLVAELSPKTKSASFTVVNTGTAPLSFQMGARRWTQDAQGQDVLEETKDLVVFPQQVEIPGGGKRIVRVGFEGDAPAQESAYRVFIEELPPAANLGQGRKGAVAVVGRFALPVFVKPDNAKGAIAIDSASAKGGNYVVKLSNTGTSRIRVVGLTASTTAKDAGAEIVNPYLLPGASREFSGPLGEGCKPGAKVTVTATTFQSGKAAKELTLPPDACRV